MGTIMATSFRSPEMAGQHRPCDKFPGLPKVKDTKTPNRKKSDSINREWPGASPTNYFTDIPLEPGYLSL
jgi:hypothetical protein